MSTEEHATQTTPPPALERKLTAIFSTDVTGYSRLMGDDEVATVHTLTAYRIVLKNIIDQHHGRVVDSPGDNLLAEFASVVEAVQAAVAVQKELAVRNAELPAHRRMLFRVGINIGDVLTEGGRLYGDGVNIAARLESLAEPGGICLSGTAREHLGNKLPLEYEYIGERAVKNIAKPVAVYKVQLKSDGTAPPTVRQEGPAPSRVKEKGPLRRWPMAALAGVLVLVMGGGVLVFRTFSLQFSPPADPAPAEEAPALPLPDKPSIAVLPFTNMSNDPEQEYFSDGLTDTLITDLSKLSGLFVIARNSTFTYKGQSVKEVSKKLGVRYVVEGGVQKLGDRVRINVQLVDATTSSHLWAERYDRPLTDMFTVQDEITQQVIGAVQVEVREAELIRVMRIPTSNLTAYDAVLRGWEYSRQLTQEGNKKARQLFEHAIELDPQYAPAYASLAGTYLREMAFQWGPARPALEQLYELAHRAVVLDDSLAQAHMHLGFCSLWKNRDHAQAIIEAERTVALAPSDAEAYWMLANFLNVSGRSEEAITVMEKAMRLNPYYPYTYAFELGHAYYLTGRYEEAIATLKQALTRHPNFLPTRIGSAISYSESGRENEARAAAAEILKRVPNYSVAQIEQTWPYQDPAVTARIVAALRKAGLK